MAPRFTVVVPTYNGEKYLDALLAAVELQEVDGELEILVVDSGSTDGTLGIVASHARVRLLTIPNSEFSHGGTRAFAARESTGDLIAFLTQDAVPQSTHWLAELAAPFSLSPRVGLVTGRQQPRPTAFPLQKYEIIGSFAALGPPWGTSLAGSVDGSPVDTDHETAGFHSDVNAMVRRDLVLGAVPFQPVGYSEDMLMADDLLQAGLLKAYAGRATVEHSNDLTRAQYGRRIFDEVVGLRRIGVPQPPISRGAVAVRALRGAVGDTIRIARDGEYSAAQKVRWWLLNPGYHLKKWTSYRRGAGVSLDDTATIAAQSLEHGARNPRA
ncbi:MAG TPA: glycosyltransferase [Pseudolysinimonas sp.]|jgi:rhamnosyltransferase